jgi:hypothetical protein
MPDRTRLEEFLGDLNYELKKFVEWNKCANDADIFTFIENTVKEALANGIGENPESLFAIVNPERSEESFDYKGKSLMVFTCQQVPVDEVLVVRLRGSAESPLDRQPGVTEDEMVMCIDFEEVETLKLKEDK